MAANVTLNDRSTLNGSAVQQLSTARFGERDEPHLISNFENITK